MVTIVIHRIRRNGHISRQVSRDWKCSRVHLCCAGLSVGQVLPACRSSEGAGSIDLQTWRFCSCVSQEAGELLRAAQVVSQAGVSTPPITSNR
jgi:hypothetical protein